VLTWYRSCLNVRKTSSSRNTGYIHFGMAFASLQAVSRTPAPRPISCSC
jgi:hypothetical protein